MDLYDLMLIRCTYSGAIVVVTEKSIFVEETSPLQILHHCVSCLNESKGSFRLQQFCCDQRLKQCHPVKSLVAVVWTSLKAFLGWLYRLWWCCCPLMSRSLWFSTSLLTFETLWNAFPEISWILLFDRSMTSNSSRSCTIPKMFQSKDVNIKRLGMQSRKLSKEAVNCLPPFGSLKESGKPLTSYLEISMFFKFQVS